MSCNGCRVLRKGCSGSCILRPCLQWIESSEAQGYATVFLAKFFGRAGLMGFISAVTEDQRPALFQSLLYEACGRTVNPVFGAVGLLRSGNWQICLAAVDAVLKGGSLRLMSPSSSLPANLSDSALYSREFAMPENLLVSLAGRVDDPTTVVFPLSSNVSADTTLDPCTMNLGIGLPEAKGQEPAEQTKNARPSKASNNDSHLGATSVKNVEFCSTWQKDGRCESRIQLHTECRRDGLGQELYELNQIGVPFQGACAATRSVRARVEPRPVAPLGSGERQSGDFSVLAHGAEQLELDLTLKVKGGKVDKMVGCKRLSSPCCSVISEGSVTSLDRTLREPLKPPCSWASDKSFLQPPFRTHLPLLQ